MTDFVLRTNSEAEMYGAYAHVGIVAPDGFIRDNGGLTDGGAWEMLEVGEAPGQTGFWTVLRWNSSEPPPVAPESVLIQWQTGDHTPYPAGLPMFA